MTQLFNLTKFIETNQNTIEIFDSDITNETIENKNLTSIIIIHSNLENITIKNCKLNAALLYSNNYINVNFQNCELDKVEFKESKFMNCSFYGCNMIKSEFYDSIMTQSNSFKNCILRSSSFGVCDLRNTVFININIEACRFFETKMYGVKLNIINNETKYPPTFTDIDFSELGDNSIIEPMGDLAEWNLGSKATKHPQTCYTKFEMPHIFLNKP
jgi:uncharacterized protein YjbI with pentapeptide repeats